MRAHTCWKHGALYHLQRKTGYSGVTSNGTVCAGEVFREKGNTQRGITFLAIQLEFPKISVSYLSITWNQARCGIISQKKCKIFRNLGSNGTAQSDPLPWRGTVQFQCPKNSTGNFISWQAPMVKPRLDNFFLDDLLRLVFSFEPVYQFAPLFHTNLSRQEKRRFFKLWPETGGSLTNPAPPPQREPVPHDKMAAWQLMPSQFAIKWEMTRGRVVIVPGNGGGDVERANWYGWLKNKLIEVI